MQVWELKGGSCLQGWELKAGQVSRGGGGGCRGFRG